MSNNEELPVLEDGPSKKSRKKTPQPVCLLQATAFETRDGQRVITEEEYSQLILKYDTLLNAGKAGEAELAELTTLMANLEPVEFRRLSGEHETSTLLSQASKFLSAYIANKANQQADFSGLVMAVKIGQIFPRVRFTVKTTTTAKFD